MSDSEKMPVTVYQIDKSSFWQTDFTEIIDDLIGKVNKAGGGFTEERLQDLNFGEYQVRIFSATKANSPRWSKFLHSILDKESALLKCKNFTNSFIGLIGFKGLIFAITGGTGSFAIERFTLENFGLEILVRLVDKDSKVIKQIQNRGVTGIVLGQTKYYRGDQRFADENQFGQIFKEVRAELNKKILTKALGLAQKSLTRNVSSCLAKSSFQLGKSVDFFTLLSLIKRFTDILSKEPNFALNKVYHLSSRNPQNQVLIRKLQEHLVENIYGDYKSDIPSDVDFCHKDFEKYFSASSFTVFLNNGETIEFEEPFHINELIQKIKTADQFLGDDAIEFRNSVLDLRLDSTNEEGIQQTTGSILEHLHGELYVDNSTYFFVDNEWYSIQPAFITDLNEECREFLSQYSDDNLITEAFDININEGDFNLVFLNKKGAYVLDTITPENIEACDILLHKDNNIYLIHVKKGFDNSVRDLASQVIISAKRIKEDIKSGYKYIDKLEKLTKDASKSASAVSKQRGSQNFPKGGLKEVFKNKKDKNIIFCMAFVDTANEERVLRDNVTQFHSNIAKYSMIELGRGIISLGFDFKVIQLKRSL